MAASKADSMESAKQRQRALQRWNNEGGAGPGGRPVDVSFAGALASGPPLGNAELVQLQVRVIALENVVITLLAQATQAQVELVRDMAAYISPRPGFTPHPLTVGAAGEMLSLVDRSSPFRPAEDGTEEPT
jgi:hypothetical protein